MTFLLFCHYEQVNQSLIQSVGSKNISINAVSLMRVCCLLFTGLSHYSFFVSLTSIHTHMHVGDQKHNFEADTSFEPNRFWICGLSTHKRVFGTLIVFFLFSFLLNCCVKPILHSHSWSYDIAYMSSVEWYYESTNTSYQVSKNKNQRNLLCQSRLRPHYQTLKPIMPTHG